MSNKIHLTLIRAKDDDPLESKEYQSEISQFNSQIPRSLLISQVSFAFDSASGAGGALGEFILEFTKELVPVLSVAVVAWFNNRRGRKVSIEYGDNKIEVDNPEDLSIALEGFKILKRESHKMEIKES